MFKQQMVPAQHVEGDGTRRFCLEGLYLITDQGSLARFDSAGELRAETDLTTRLTFRLQAVLNQYRSGAVDPLSLGLVTGSDFGPPWSSEAMVFGSRVRRELFNVDTTAAPPSASNRADTVFQGMELLLNRTRPSQPSIPCFCPVLFIPEVDYDTLCERYDVDFLAGREVFEVLDLCAPFVSSTRLPDELLTMVTHMRQAQMDAAFRIPDDARADEAEADGATALLMQLPAPRREPRDAMEAGSYPEAAGCFVEGEPVTGWLLEWFSPFNELTDTQREIIAGYETIRNVEAGTNLIEKGSGDDTCIYLVEGVLALEGPDGGVISVKAGTRRSRLPISVLNPHVYNVTATTDSSVVMFSQRLVRKIIEITRTYTSVDRARVPETSTAEISNGVQAVYLNPVNPPHGSPSTLDQSNVEAGCRAPAQSSLVINRRVGDHGPVTPASLANPCHRGYKECPGRKSGNRRGPRSSSAEG